MWQPNKSIASVEATDMSVLTIGKVAEKSQVTADSIRYYEREGLLRPAKKSASGYRLYTDDAIRRIRFIKQAQDCGFSLAEIREMLELRSTGKGCCDDIYRVSVQRKLQLEHKIKALTAMSHALSRLIDMCSHDRKSLAACPILAALDAGAARRNGKGAKARIGGKSK